MKYCIQINLQTSFGGGEIYTSTLSHALSSISIPSRIYVHAANRAWASLKLPADTQIIPTSDADDLPDLLGKTSSAWVVCHTYPSQDTIAALQRQGHFVTAFAHMPLFERSPEPLKPFDLIFPVSNYVKSTLLASGLTQTYPAPMYGIAHMERASGTVDIKRNSCFDWDRRKFRDRIMSYAEPWFETIRPVQVFAKRPGFTLGIVSRLTPIKQFPLLFSVIAPVLQKNPEINLEIFGAGGYASVRDLKTALSPIRSQVRFWGYQQNVAAIYRQIDALLTGLPEKEALGLNVIEAQHLGIPVLAPNAAPFTETILHEATGLLYRDPRHDSGREFGGALERLLSGSFKFDSNAAFSHLERFSEAAFKERCVALARFVNGTMTERCQ